DHDHRAFLGPTIAEELRAWRRVSGAESKWVFPKLTNHEEHITSESISKAYRVTMGLKDEHSPHGWRSSFSTLADGSGFHHVAVEMGPDHVARNEVARAYDRGERRHLRIELANWWDAELVKAERGTP